jgi:hypothetical protein
VSVAASRKKGKSELMKDSRRSLRQGLGILMTFEIPQKQNEEEHNREHHNGEVMAICIGTARW